MKMNLKKIITIALYSGFFLIIINQAQAAGLLQQNIASDITNNTGIVQTQAGYASNITIGDVVGTIIKAFLGLLGIIFIILMLIAGFNWMTAGGEEEKITKAKDTIRAAMIGLIIVVAAYAITYFVFANLPGGGSGGVTNAG